MPIKKSDSHKRAAAARRQVMLAREASPELRYLLRNRKAAMEKVFSATHGRAMTDAERESLLKY